MYVALREFFRREHPAIVPLTVREILDENSAMKWPTRKTSPQGLKPARVVGFGGTTKVVPFPILLRRG